MTLVKIYIWWNFVGMHALNKFVVQGEIVSKKYIWMNVIPHYIRVYKNSKTGN